jgi:hypothetical protein
VTPAPLVIWLWPGRVIVWTPPVPKQSPPEGVRQNTKEETDANGSR